MFDKILIRIENFLLRPLLSSFRFLSKRISYTFAIAFLTSIGGFVVAGYIFLFVSATVNFEASGTANNFINLFFIITLLLYAPAYYLHFGALCNIRFKYLRFPCFSSSLNTINKYIRRNRLRIHRSPENAKNLLEALERLPYLNVVVAFIYPSIVMLAVVIQELLIGLSFNALFIFIGISSAIFIYVFFTYIAAELLTGVMRRRLQRYMRLRNVPYKEKFILSIRKKFVFIAILVFISMSELILMFQFGKKNISTVHLSAFVVMAVFIVSVILFLYLVSIEDSLFEIELAAIDLGRGGKGDLYISSMDKELVSLSKGIMSAAYEVNDIRSNLEKKVEERTKELKIVLNALTLKDKEMEMELDIASDIQQGILPATPLKHKCFNIVSYYKSMGRVGGDLFDIFTTKSGNTAILIADVSGHGIPAALVTAMAKISFSDASRSYDSPVDIFSHVNKNILDIIKGEEYLTAFLIVINSGLELSYSNASHRKAIVYKKQDSSVELWDTHGLFIGLLEDGDYKQKHSKLNQGDRIFLYTDGLPEARNKEDEEFGEARLIELIKDTKDLPLEKAKLAILENWQNFLQDAAVIDDVTFLLLEIDKKVHNNQN